MIHHPGIASTELLKGMIIYDLFERYMIRAKEYVNLRCY